MFYNTIFRDFEYLKVFIPKLTYLYSTTSLELAEVKKMSYKTLKFLSKNNSE